MTTMLLSLTALIIRREKETEKNINEDIGGDDCNDNSGKRENEYFQIKTKNLIS